MAPPHKSVAELGTVKLDGQYSDGPQRATWAEAQRDLDGARQCQTRAEMKKCVA